MGHVEPVIYNLKGEADRLPKTPEPFNFAVLRPGVKPTADQASRDERCRLRAMDVFQHLRRGLSVFGLQIHDLTADHPVERAGAVRDLFDHPNPRLPLT